MEDGNRWIAGRETYLLESAGMKLSFYYSLNNDVGAWLRFVTSCDPIQSHPSADRQCLAPPLFDNLDISVRK
jgi:hypothetical protein